MDNKYSIGTDIIEVERIREATKRHGQRFLNHVFTKDELDWCMNRKDPYIHLAGRFAAKEAVRKALGSLGERDVAPFNTIEIVRSKNGAPLVKIHRSLSQSYQFQISMSHLASFATAVAIAELV